MPRKSKNREAVAIATDRIIPPYRRYYAYSRQLRTAVLRDEVRWLAQSQGSVIARSMGRRHIRVADRPVWTAIHAFPASLTGLGMIEARMAMVEKDYFPKDTVWT